MIVGSSLSVFFVAWFRPEILTVLENLKMDDVAKFVIASRPELASEWFFPINAGLTLLCGWLGKLILDGLAESQS